MHYLHVSGAFESDFVFCMKTSHISESWLRAFLLIKYLSLDSSLMVRPITAYNILQTIYRMPEYEREHA